jgi:hypothetical protein
MHEKKPSGQELHEEYLPPIEKVGSSAVKLALEQAMETGEVDDEHLRNELAIVRHQLEDMSIPAKKRLNNFIEMHTDNLFIENILRNIPLEHIPTKGLLSIFKKDRPQYLPADKNVDWVSTLTRKDAQDNFLVDDRTFLNFLEWHNYELAEGQKELDALAEVLKQQFADKVGQAVKDNHLPEAALHNLVKLNEIKLILDDGTELKTFQDHQQGGKVHTASYKDAREAVIMTMPLGFKPDNRTVSHEFAHVIDGENRWKKFYPNLSIMLGEPINEAVTEHIAQSLDNGKFDIISPAQRGDTEHTSAYLAYRELLSTLINDGAEPVDINDFYNVYFANDHGQNGQPDPAAEDQFNRYWNKLVNSLERAWPEMDVVDRIRALPERDTKYGSTEVRPAVKQLDEMLKSYSGSYHAGLRAA